MENWENEQYAALGDEVLRRVETHNMPLLPRFIFDKIRRVDLPKDHPNAFEPGYLEIDGQKILRHLFVQAWFNAFEALLKNRSKTIKIEAELTGVWSPKEYNFACDQAEFTISLSLSDLGEIRRQVMEHQSVFEAYLHEVHSSCSGYWSFVPNNIEDWQQQYAKYLAETAEEEGGYPLGWEQAVWQLLDFWLLAFPEDCAETIEPSLKIMERSREDFQQEVEWHEEQLRSNGVEEEYLIFHPGELAMRYGPDWWHDAPKELIERLEHYCHEPTP